jgi:hypothetical protein
MLSKWCAHDFFQDRPSQYFILGTQFYQPPFSDLPKIMKNTIIHKVRTLWFSPEIIQEIIQEHSDAPSFSAFHG